MNVIFLDIDGVMNNYQTRINGNITPSGYDGIDDKFVERIRQILSAVPNTKIVLTSDWKELFDEDMVPLKVDGYKDAQYLLDKFKKFGIEVKERAYGFLKDDELCYEPMARGKEIKFYLDSHKDVDNWVVLDHRAFDFERTIGLERFVKTSGVNGLTEENVRVVIKILKGSNEENKNSKLVHELHLWLDNTSLSREFYLNRTIKDTVNNIKAGEQIIFTTQSAFLSYNIAEELYVHYNSKVIHLKYNSMCENNKDFYAKNIINVISDLFTNKQDDIAFNYITREFEQDWANADVKDDDF